MIAVRPAQRPWLDDCPGAPVQPSLPYLAQDFTYQENKLLGRLVGFF